MPDPSEQTTGRPHREQATHLDDLRAELAEARETIRILNDSYREAVGVPPSQHQARRLEQMAQRLESAQAEAFQDREAFVDILQAIAPDGVCDCEGPCDVYRIYTIANDRLAAHGGGP